MSSYRGNLIIVAAPSGGGKTSLVHRVAQTLEKIEISISHTTRVMRPGEKDGEDYFFVNETQFLSMIETDAFLEHAQVFSHYYGTSRQQIEARLEAGIDVLLDIDWQGAQQIRRFFKDALSVFILPPSLATLKERLYNRKQDNEEVIQARMRAAQGELRHFDEFDYLIINKEFEKAAQELEAIIISNRLTLKRQILQQQELLSFLCAEH